MVSSPGSCPSSAEEEDEPAESFAGDFGGDDMMKRVMFKKQETRSKPGITSQKPRSDKQSGMSSRYSACVVPRPVSRKFGRFNVQAKPCAMRRRVSVACLQQDGQKI